MVSVVYSAKLRPLHSRALSGRRGAYYKDSYFPSNDIHVYLPTHMHGHNNRRTPTTSDWQMDLFAGTYRAAFVSSRLHSVTCG